MQAIAGDEATPPVLPRLSAPRASFRVTRRSADMPSTSTVEACLELRGVRAAASPCIVVADGIDDGWHFGQNAIQCSFSAVDPGKWQLRQGVWRWALSVWRGPNDQADTAYAWMSERFKGIQVRVWMPDRGITASR